MITRRTVLWHRLAACRGCHLPWRSTVPVILLYLLGRALIVRMISSVIVSVAHCSCHRVCTCNVAVSVALTYCIDQHMVEPVRDQ